MNDLVQTFHAWLAQPEPPSGLRIRNLESGDRERVLAVVDEWWGRPMSGLLPRPFFVHFRDTSFVLVRGDELVAFLVGFLSQTHDDEAYIHAAAVAPAFRGEGLGRLLYQRFADVARRNGRRRIRAITAARNTGSLDFHRRLGFQFELPTAATGADRVALVLELPPELPADELEGAEVNADAAALRVPLVGRQVALEPLERNHEVELWSAAADSDWRWMPIDAGSSHDAFSSWLEWVLANANKEPAVPFAVVRRDTGRAIGSTSYHTIHPEHRRVEIGMTWYLRSEWSSGANVEAKLLMLEQAFALGFRRVEFKTDARNERSRRALEALPARFEGLLRKHMLVRGGEERDSAYYSVIEDEWPSVRENLERRLAR
jgi:RimJ/RimL family protein N-acetyltransferase